LQFIIGIMGNIADPTPVYDGRFFLFIKKPVEFHIVAGGDNQSVDRPFIAVNLNASVLDDTQVNLNQILLVFKYFVAEMDAATGNARQCTAS